MLGVDRQELLVLAYPEARTLLAEPPFEPSSEAARHGSDSSKIMRF